MFSIYPFNFIYAMHSEIRTEKATFNAWLRTKKMKTIELQVQIFRAFTGCNVLQGVIGNITLSNLQNKDLSTPIVALKDYLKYWFLSGTGFKILFWYKPFQSPTCYHSTVSQKQNVYWIYSCLMFTRWARTDKKKTVYLSSLSRPCHNSCWNLFRFRMRELAPGVD